MQFYVQKNEINLKFISPAISLYLSGAGWFCVKGHLSCGSRLPTLAVVNTVLIVTYVCFLLMIKI